MGALEDNRVFREDYTFGKKALNRFFLILRDEYPIEEITKSKGGGEIDKEMAIDFRVHFPNKVETWAGKFRRMGKRSFNDVTVEVKDGDGKKGDWFHFRGGSPSKYVYGWAEENPVKVTEFLILKSKKLVGIPLKHFNSHMERFEGLFSIRVDGKRVKCKRNDKHGGAFFTAIGMDTLKKFPSVIEYHWTREPESENRSLNSFIKREDERGRDKL